MPQVTNHDSEITFDGDFNIHHVGWLGSSKTKPRGEQAHDLAALSGLQYFIQHPIRIPDCHGHQPNILYLFFISTISLNTFIRYMF